MLLRKLEVSNGADHRSAYQGKEEQMQRRQNRQAQTGMQLEMVFGDARSSGANLTGKVLGREIDLLRQQQAKSFGLTLADAVSRNGPYQTRAYCRR